MKKTRLSIVAFALLAFGLLGIAQSVRANDSVKADSASCLPSSVFCLDEKAKSTFYLSEEARKDIGITEEQSEKIRELVKTAKAEIEKDIKQLQPPKKDASKAECKAFRGEMKKVCEKYYPQCMEKLGKILDEKQIEKMQTRVFQYSGLMPCPIALKVLKLNDEQLKKLEPICDQMCENVAQCMGDADMSEGKLSDEIIQKLTQCRKDCEEKVRSILTKEQLAKAEKLISETPAYVKKMQEEHCPIKAASKAHETK